MRPLTYGILVCAPAAPGFSHERLLRGRRGEPPTQEVEAMADLRSAADLCATLRELGHAATPIVADDALLERLIRSDVDAAILALHGRRGGSGAVQTLLARLGIAFPGADGSTVSRAFDKAGARAVLKRHNVPVPASLHLVPGRSLDDGELERLGWPCLVKPRRGSHAAGVRHLVAPETIGEAIGAALAVDGEVLLEREIVGREIQVVLLGSKVIGCAEVHARSELGEPSELTCPCDLSPTRLSGVYGLARRAAEALGLVDGPTRVDILLDERRNEFVLEVEPLPSLARDGVVARVAHAAGIDHAALVQHLLDRIVLRPWPRTADVSRAMLQ